eukprot:TRINITY_DN61730_c0_g1_i1.p1 TRINITY_DN61730_c0_g1~~TRINITY_DN61730_c0_g1_i1.p1  ORF type:complete len:680 (-),score=92.71 TRINITY_DN61730_c0_g1_i1:90-2129(-)
MAIDSNSSTVQSTETSTQEQSDTPVQPVLVQARPPLKDYFSVRPVPWWLCFSAGIFILMKFQLLYHSSPCAVLGTQSPVDTQEIKKAFRAISICTHPDRLRGRLKRDPTNPEYRRAEILFNRASSAKDAVLKVLSQRRGQKKIPCYEGELEMAVFEIFAEVGKVLSNLGVKDVVTFVKDLLWTIVSFQLGIMNTILSLLCFGFVFRVLKMFLVYMWDMGLIHGVLSMVTTTIIGPVPTVLYFFVLPFLRLAAFAGSLCNTGTTTDSDAQSAPTDLPQSGDEPSAPSSAEPVPSTAKMAVATESVNRNTLRQRKKKESEETKEKRNRELLAGTAEVKPDGDTGPPPPGTAPMPTGIWQIVSLTNPAPVKARQAAAAAVQFDMLLVLTKPIIPLMMLIAMGQVWNGLFSSLFIGHVLRRWVPQMSYEAQHLLCCFFGVVHTLLGVSASQVEDFSNREGANVLHLAWSWSFKDVLCVMNMALFGSTVTAISGLGNEPSYAASFASGIALRIALGQDTVRELGTIKAAGRWIEGSLRDLGVALDAADEVVVYSGGGIGDCAGGPFRMLVGDSWARWAAIILKVWLMLIPLLATAQWLQRSCSAGRVLGKRWKTTRFVQRVVLFCLGLLQCCMIVNAEMNASNGALVNFWIAMLIGCVIESLLCSYDIRGALRQLVSLFLFLLV